MLFGSGLVSIGKLYDATTDKVLTPIALWTKESIESMTLRKETPQVLAQVHTSSNVNDRMKHMDLDVSLKLSFLCGLLDVTGSGEYLADEQEHGRLARVTLSFKEKTFTEQLQDNNHNNIDHPNVCNLVPEATHVITSGKPSKDSNKMFLVLHMDFF